MGRKIFSNDDLKNLIMSHKFKTQEELAEKISQNLNLVDKISYTVIGRRINAIKNSASSSYSIEKIDGYFQIVDASFKSRKKLTRYLKSKNVTPFTDFDLLYLKNESDYDSFRIANHSQKAFENKLIGSLILFDGILLIFKKEKGSSTTSGIKDYMALIEEAKTAKPASKKKKSKARG